jgi:HlyD family secretion protein
MNKTLKWILISLGILVVIVVIIGKAMGNSQGDGIKVSAEKAQLRTVTETVNAPGKIYPEVEVKISPDISGEITDLTVQEGDSVRRGQVLARIYADIYSSQRDEARARVSQSQATVANSEAALESLKAQLDLAKTTLARNRDLFDQKVISRSELEQYETQVRTTQSQYNAAVQNIRSLEAGTQSTRTSLEMANKNLGRATITAPMDGVVSLLNVKKGERVVGTAQMAGTEMMRVADMNVMEVRVDVPENDIVKVKLGDSADVEVEAYNNRKFKGVVTQIASSTTKTGSVQASASDVSSYEVRIRLDPSSYADLVPVKGSRNFVFRPGMNASADIRTRQRAGIVTVPIASVASKMRGSDKSVADQKKEKKKTSGDESADDENLVGGDELEEVVFVVGKDGLAERRVVTTGIQDINYIEVTSGLKQGDQVITGPYNAVSKTLRSGSKIILVPKEKLFDK